MKTTNTTSRVIFLCASVFILIALITVSKATDYNKDIRSGTVAAKSVDVKIGMSHGPVKDGLAAFLYCERKKFTVGEQVPLNIGLVYWGTSKEEPAQSVTVQRPCGPLNPGGSSWFIVKDSDGNDVSYTGWIASFKFTEGNVSRLTSKLYRGSFLGTHCKDGEINGYRLEKPGIYTITWHYRTIAFPGSCWWQGELVSNEIQFEIVK